MITTEEVHNTVQYYGKGIHYWGGINGSSFNADASRWTGIWFWRRCWLIYNSKQIIQAGICGPIQMSSIKLTADSGGMKIKGLLIWFSNKKSLSKWYSFDTNPFMELK